MNLKLILLVTIPYLFSCYNIVETRKALCEYSKIENSDGLINIKYMSCDTYYGDSSISHGVFKYPNSDIPSIEISKLRGYFEINNSGKKNNNCKKGDCINGDGIEEFDLVENDILHFKEKVTGKSGRVENKMYDIEYEYGHLTYKGSYKNYLKYNGIVTDETGKVIANYVNGQETITLYFTDKKSTIKSDVIKRKEDYIINLLQREYGNLDNAYMTERRDKRRKYLMEEYGEFINTMYKLGARDLNSCIRLCNKHMVRSGCSTSCEQSMEINR